MTPETSRELRGRFSSFLNQELAGPIRETYLWLKNQAVGYKEKLMAGHRIDAQPDQRMTQAQWETQQKLIREGLARSRRDTKIELLIATGLLAGALAIGYLGLAGEQTGTSANVDSQNNARPSITVPAPAEAVEVYTATAPATFTPLPTATFAPTETATATDTAAEFTPTPEPTETQNYIDSRYPSCTRGLHVVDGLDTPRKAVRREDDGTKLPTGLSWSVGNYSNTYYDATAVYSCIDNIDGVVDPIFGDGAITMDIVLYDVYGNEHRYPARTNGYAYNNEPIYLLPFQLYSEDKGQDSTVGNVRKKISDKNGAQAETVLMTADRTDLWVGSGLINLHKEFLDLLIKAVVTGRNFPEPLVDGFRIQILALALY